MNEALTIGYAAALGLLIGIVTAYGWLIGLLAIVVFVLAHLLCWVVEAWAATDGWDDDSGRGP